MLAEFAAHLRVGNGLHHGAEDIRADFPPVQRGGIEPWRLDTGMTSFVFTDFFGTFFFCGLLSNR
jgi:hypothetical protein